MADFDYWRRQRAEPLFGEVDVMRPEQRRFAGKLLLIGGNKGPYRKLVRYEFINGFPSHISIVTEGLPSKDGSWGTLPRN